MTSQFPYLHLVPKGFEENLLWRRQLLEQAELRPEIIPAIKHACRVDPLFYINSFVWTFDPRDEDHSKLPFITYKYQDEGYAEIFKALGSYDMLAEKSRDMGASWMFITAIEHEWHFKSWKSYLLVSRTANYVDQSGNPKSLFWKIDFVLKNLPLWLLPEKFDWGKHRRMMHLDNPETGSVIDGESTTGHVAQGDRRTAIVLDEFALVEEGYSVLSATRDVTKSRLFNSTPNGAGGAYHEVVKKENIKKLRMHWSKHPVKAAGLYTKHQTGFEIIDKVFWAKVEDPQREMERYDLIIAKARVPIPFGKLRSPWYADECSRALHQTEIAQELDIDYGGTDYQFFSPDKIETHVTKHAYPAHLVGELDYDLETIEPLQFEKRAKGRFQLWLYLDAVGEPPRDRLYTVGADVAAGTGASNSCLSIYDCKTGEKVGEYANPSIRPEEFARVSVAICRWLGRTCLIWEDAGPGQQFGAAVLDTGFRDVFLRRVEKKLSKRRTQTPGYPASKPAKKSALSAYRMALEAEQFINHSEPALMECLQFIHLPNGSVEHSGSLRTIDPTGVGHNHGDRTIADSLAWVAFTDRSLVKIAKAKRGELRPGKTDPRSFAGRRKLFEDSIPEKW